VHPLPLHLGPGRDLRASLEQVAIEAATGMDLAGKMIQKLERKLGWGRSSVQEAAGGRSVQLRH
jgi:hypothetical protein